MTTKEQIIEELDRLPEEHLSKVLEVIQQMNESTVSRKDRFSQALQDTLEENAGLYTRLADA